MKINETVTFLQPDKISTPLLSQNILHSTGTELFIQWNNFKLYPHGLPKSGITSEDAISYMYIFQDNFYLL